MGVFKAIGYIISGTLILLLILCFVVLGTFWGMQSYLNNHQELKASFEIPMDGQAEPVTVNIYNQAGQTETDIQQNLDEATLQGQMELFIGPLSMKAVGLRVGIDIPVEELVDEIGDQISIDLGGAER